MLEDAPAMSRPIIQTEKVNIIHKYSENFHGETG
jgi:hypothetical protein